MNQITEEAIISFFAVSVTIISLVTWGAITVLEVKRIRTNYYMMALDLIAVFLMAWYSVGYAALLFGRDVSGAFYFRPVTPILVMLFTGMGVMLHKKEINAENLAESSRNIDKLNERVAYLEKLEYLERSTATTPLPQTESEDG